MVPEATTAKDTVVPAGTVCVTGCVVIDGADGVTESEAEFDVTGEPMPLLTITS